MESLRDKLKSLGVQTGMDSIKKQEPGHTVYPIDLVIDGEFRKNNFGSAFVVEKNFPAGFRHGNVDLCKIQDYNLLSRWAKSNLLSSDNYQNILFLDAETTGLAGGTGTFAFMIGLGHFSMNGFKFIQLFLQNPADEKAFLLTLDQILSSFEIIVTYNGKSFDIPLMTSRYVLQKHPVPFKNKEHIDLLHLARRVWRNRLASRTLGTLETEILNLGRTQEEVPGWMVPELYTEYLKTGDAHPLTGVFYHNEIDILSLAAIFNVLAQMLSSPLESLFTENLDCIAIAGIYEDLGYTHEAIKLYERSIGEGLPVDFLTETLNRYAKIHKRNGDWDSARKLWETSAGYNNIESCIELAKYYEHVRLDPSSALMWTNLAGELLKTNRNQKNFLINDIAIEKRLKRLTEKENNRVNR